MATIQDVIERQHQFYFSGKTRSYHFRMAALCRLEQAIKDYQKEIEQALKKDLHKSEFESYMTEIGMIFQEIHYLRKHLKQWMKPQYVPTPLAQFPARSFSTKEPYGVVLIMAPWNYPFLLSLQPLIGAIAAGNCCILKPSEYAPHAAKVLTKIIYQAFPMKYVTVFNGDKTVSQNLLNQSFDYIFYTGSGEIGKLVMKKASKRLIPVTLELGGKSPCIVEKSADLRLAAKRIVFGKFLNSGQTCVAPDYVFVDEQMADEFVQNLKYWIKKMFGKQPLRQPDYPSMINKQHYQRVMRLIKNEDVAAGGYGNMNTLQIAPTILINVKKEAPIMQEEIFGPILPILTYKNIKQVKQYISSHGKPLALYLFTRDPLIEKDIIEHLSYGGGCINDTIIHLATPFIGFGGVGSSGMGSYHGKDSFDTFTHKKSIVKKSIHLDLPIRYMPYSVVKKCLMKFFLKF